MRSVTAEDWAFIAGIFDADGTVSRGNRLQARGKTLLWHVGITNKNLELLEWIQERAGGNISTQGKDRGVWQLYWRTLERGGFLMRILPFIIVKRNMALKFLFETYDGESIDVLDKD